MYKKPLAIAGLTLALVFSQNGHSALINGDFESGLSGWQVFGTSNSVLGQAPRPGIIMFDTNGDSILSNSFSVSVGYNVAPCAVVGIYCPHPAEGGGITQSVYFSEGTYSFSVDIAVENQAPYGGYNADGGTFVIAIDSLVLDTLSFTNVQKGVARGKLSYSGYVTEGTHDVGIWVTRGYTQADGLYQYFDNASITEVPAPATAWLMGSGLIGLLGISRRKK